MGRNISNGSSSQGGSGGAGSGGSGSVAVELARRIEIVSESLIYKATAAIGSVETDPVWRICRITVVADTFTEEYVNGVGTFTNIWTQRNLLNYS